MKNVKNRASPISTWLGGEDCVPKAMRNNDRTMIMRVKLDIMSTIAGINVNEVSSINACRLSV